MGQVLLKASAYVFVIALGYALKKLHFFGPNDYKLIMKIVLNITTPAAVITNFASFDFDVSLLYVTLLGLLCNLGFVGGALALGWFSNVPLWGGIFLVLFLEWGLYNALVSWIGKVDALNLLQFVPFAELLWPMMGTFGAAGLFVGIFGSFTSIRRFLDV